MNRIEATFRQLKAQRAKALIAYLTVGYPSVKLMPSLVKGLESAGVDLIELGIPFSDPLADGPTIQAASSHALRQGVTPRTVLSLVRTLRRQGVKLPLVLMTYVNPVNRYGMAAFCKDAAGAGVDGLIIPDLPPEEAGEWVAAARPCQLSTIFLAAPTSPKARLRRIAARSTGFIYYVSLTGVTGARAQLPKAIASHVRSIRGMTRLPVCVGFGISKPAQVRQVARVADGVIVGSALLNVLSKSKRNPVAAATRFAKSLRRACNG